MKALYFLQKEILTEDNFCALFSAFKDVLYVCLDNHFTHNPIRISGGYNCFLYNHFEALLSARAQFCLST